MTSLLSPAPHVIGLKLGGSDITDKERTAEFPTTIDEIIERGGEFIHFERLDAIAGVLDSVLQEQPELRLVLVHGAGPFGHKLAHKVPPEVVHHSVEFLNNCVRAIFQEHGLMTESISPFDHCQVIEDRKRFVMEPMVKKAVEILASDRIPIGYGDMAPFSDGSHRYGVVSGDDILPAICAHPTVNMSRMVMLCKYQLYDRDPRPLEKPGQVHKAPVLLPAPPAMPVSDIEVNDASLETQLKEKGIKIEQNQDERSEGMPGKVKACYDFTWLTRVPSVILPFEVLEQGLRGEAVGTSFAWND